MKHLLVTCMEEREKIWKQSESFVTYKKFTYLDALPLLLLLAQRWRHQFHLKF